MRAPIVRRSQALTLASILIASITIAAAPGPNHTISQDDDANWAHASFLYEGRIADGEKALIDALQTDPGNRQLRFGLGTTQFLGAIEGLAQTLHRYGATQESTFGAFVPFARLPIPKNETPEEVRPADLRAALVQLVETLKRVDDTLRPLDETEVKLAIDLGRVRLDLDGDGVASADEGLWRLYEAIARGDRNADEAPNDEPHLVVFDRGDIAWLRGYSHLLSALAECVLAYDMHGLFNHAAHLVFPKAVRPYDFLRVRDAEEVNQDLIVDAIAAVHMMKFPLKEPARMQTALAHLESCIALSRESWRLYSAETDDDHEWIPNPNQAMFLGERGRVTREMITGWSEFLDEFEAILAGKTLVPFWRDADGKGVNLRRVFTEPREFDLVLWAQGTAAAPYLENGNVTRPEVWTRLQRTFGGQFFGFAMWFN